MTNKNERPVEEELRSSQVYRTLTGSGIPLAGKLAQGLGKAAQGVDSALTGVFPVVKKAARSAVYRQAGWQQPPSGQAQPGQPYAQQPQNPQNTQYAQNTQRPQNAQRAPGAGQQGATPSQAGQDAGYYRYSYQYRYTPQGNPAQQAQSQQAQRPAQGQQPQGQQAQQPAQGQRPQGQPHPAQAAAQQPMKLVHTGSPAKFYLTGGAAILYALVGPMDQPYHFLLFAVVLVLVFLLSSVLFKGKKKFVPIEPEKPKEEPKPKQEEKEEKASSTGDPEVDKLIQEGKEYLKKLRAADDAIPDETLSADITRMEKASADIFRFIGEHPEKAPEIRKFMNYYLPTTLKLLNSYQRLSSQSVKGETISSTLFNIAGMMHTVADAFEKQLDSLFADEAMDISADITVFETLLKQEGFVEETKAKK